MRFVDFLKAAVLLSAGAGTALAAAAIVGAANGQRYTLALLCVGWWLAAAAIGAWMGRRVHTSPAIARLLASARHTTALPEQQPGRTLLNRLWPLLVATIGAGALAFVAPQVPGIAAGFMIIWALAWRRQEQAVSAIEERDGARFYVEQASPVRAMRLIRTPGFRAHFAPLSSSDYDKAETTP